MRQSLAEVLAQAAQQKSNENKIAALTMNDTPQLRKLLKYILDPQVVWWDFLKGTPAPYKPNRYMDAEGRLFSDIRILYMFVETGDDDWAGINNDQRLTRMSLQKNPRKRQNIWLQLLESISPEDAELLCAAPHKKLPFPGLSREIIDEAFPGLLAPENSATPAPPPVMQDTAMPSHSIPPQVANPKPFEYED